MGRNNIYRLILYWAENINRNNCNKMANKTALSISWSSFSLGRQRGKKYILKKWVLGMLGTLTLLFVLLQVLTATWNVYLTVRCARRTQFWWICIRGCILAGPTTPMSPPLCPGSRERSHRRSVTLTWTRGRKLWTKSNVSITWLTACVTATQILILCTLIDN